MNLQFLTAFGDHVSLSQFKPDDTISTLAFSSDGQFLASGDNAGRVVFFKIGQGHKPTVSFATQTHAHKAEFDYFRSELSEMKVNSLKWIPCQTMNHLLLSCNSHDAKLWRFITDTRISWNDFDESQEFDTFVFPTPRQVDNKYSTECIRTFFDTQIEYIVDLQTLSDQKSFLMVDISCVKLWDIERQVSSVCLCKVSQQDPEITTSGVDPRNPSTFIVGDDFGFCKLFDIRQQAEDLTPIFDIDTHNYSSQHMQLDGCECVGSIAFSHEGNYFAVRRFGDVQIWDVRNVSSPAAKLDVQWFPNKMNWLIEDDYVKDQFRTTFTPKGKVVTGCYSADFMTWDWKNQKTSQHKAVSARMPRLPPEVGSDFNKRVTVCEAHPTEEVVAVVSTAALFLFYEPK
ncbi:protein phosphatase PP2A regulatory subunit B [Histomonas meleagridis]|uniref:protein phosphatase PP2A regulatory subunit B n=1 Tax=Histomonas meleagridis TaxID=135588 RepID=UPI0035598514|nr:protein phosphatase PP2A regulatory subunit B [Histomonas meleagridis]KAH0801384.1 protein phosphatase PP2A regulatory subunit B [Histomonas meleagridis]